MIIIIIIIIIIFSLSMLLRGRNLIIKFLGVLLDENLNWKKHIKYTENKIAKH